VYDTRREENIQDLNQHLKMYLANLNTMCQFKYLSRDSAELQRYLTPLLCLQSKIATSTNHAKTKFDLDTHLLQIMSYHMIAIYLIN